jgi:hypothetical protein
LRSSTGVGGSIVLPELVGTIAVPIAKNSITWLPQPWLLLMQVDADDARRLELLRLGLHPLHRELARLV